MSDAISVVHKPENAKFLSYAPGSEEKASIKKKITELKSEQIEIPLIIAGKEVRTGNMGECRIPHDKNHVLASYHMAGEKEVQMAIDAAVQAQQEWAALPWEHRLSVFLKAAGLIEKKWRDEINAATMLGQSKTVFEAEADSACELMDFFTVNSYMARQILEEQPHTAPGMFNRLNFRPLEGFVFAVTPFNFTAIAGNLPTSPAMLGNTAVWKPASSAVFSNYKVMQILMEAGLPAGVINFIPSKGSVTGPQIMGHKMFAGVHFTGSTATFNSMWQTIAGNLDKYRSYPRIVGETGGKDFVFAHVSADTQSLLHAIIGGGYSYQGQKCSATSRVYIPESLWKTIKSDLIEEVSSIPVGDTEDFTNYMGAVIDEAAYKSITSYIDYAKNANDAQIIAGGTYSDTQGYFVQPTVILTDNPNFKTMEEEIFGPVVTVFVYKDSEYEQALDLCEKTSDYALTGGIFARDRHAIATIEQRLNYSAGNLYINDKTTGAFMGLQPFGGSRASGTNEKVGSKFNLTRWVNPKTVKESFVPITNYRLPYMQEK